MATSNVTALAGDKSVAELANRLVQQKIVAAPSDMTAFTSALLAANPHLKQIGVLPAGTPVVIPNPPTVPTIGAESDPVVHAVMNGLRATLSGAQGVYAQAAANQKARASALSSPDAVAAITALQAKDAALGQRLLAISNGVANVLTKVDSTVTAQTTSIQTVVGRIGNVSKVVKIG